MYSTLYLLILSILILCRPVSSCTSDNVTVFVQQEYDRMVLLERRGVPKPMAEAFFSMFINKLVGFVEVDGSKSIFGGYCMTSTRKDDFGKVYNNSVFDSELDNMLLEAPHVFYLSSNNVTDADIPALSLDNQKKVASIWSDIRSHMETRTTANVNSANLVQLPETLDIFYDPAKQQVCEDYHAWEDDASDFIEDLLEGDEEEEDDDDDEGQGIASGILAVDLFWDVVGIAVRMKISGIETDEPRHILEHNAAVLFKVIRCTRNSANITAVPDLFRGWYNSIADNMIVGDNSLKYTPKIDRSVVKGVYGSGLELFASYGGWGQIESFNFTGAHVETVSLEDILYNEKSLRDVEVIVSGTNRNVGMSLGNEVVRQVSCTDGMETFLNPPTTPDTVCCPVLCRETHLLSMGLLFAREFCCETFDANPLSSLLVTVVEVFIETYGFSPGRWVPLFL